MDLTGDHRFNQYSKQFSSTSPSRHEPMVMGSPSSPHPGSHNTSQYLPGFLLGDQTPGPAVVASPVIHGSRGLWSSNSGSGGGSVPRLINQSNAQSPQVFGSSKKFADRIDENIAPIRSKDKLSAPPVSGLLDTSISTPSQHLLLDNVESKHQLTAGFSSPLPSLHQHNFSLTQMSHSTPAVVSSSGTSFHQNLNTSQASFLSPPQVDPFYTQGEELSPHDILDETWVTVFGFAQGAAGHILQQFNEYGTILDHVISNDGNWMHLHYKSRISAKKALSKNGKVIGNNMMVGVRQCIDQSVMRGDSPSETAEDNHISLHSVSSTIPLKTLGSLYEPSTTGTPGKSSTPIRPLTKAYQAKSPADIPHSSSNQKEDAWWKKVMEYAFGW